MTSYFRFRFHVSIAIALSCIFFAGCETRPTDAFAEAAAGGERPVAMSGSSDFFSGKLSATVTLSRGLGRKTGNPAGGGSGQRAARGGGGGSHGGGKYRGGQADVSEMEPEEAEAYLRARQAMGSQLPPITARLKLENHTTEPIEVEILEVNSELGNFAVRPAKITIAPGETGEPDPMISQLGVTSDEVPVKVALKVAGSRENQTLVLKNVRSADAPPLSK